MHLANRAIRLVTVMAATAAIALTIGTTTAGAAVAAPRTTPHSTTAHPAAATTAKPKAQQIPAAPSGCNSNNFCDYSSGNGGNLCFQQSTSRAVWPIACADHNEGEYNRNGNAVYMYRNAYYSGCWYLLYSGHYLLYNANDHFQSGGCTNITLEHKLYSHRFV